MAECKILLNFDVTTITASMSRNRSWKKKGGATDRCYKKEYNGLSLLLAVSNDGCLFYMFLDGNHN